MTLKRTGARRLQAALKTQEAVLSVHNYRSKVSLTSRSLDALLSAMRPAYLAPKLTDANRLEIRRLRAENPREWTLRKLAGRFGVHRSTVSHVIRRRMRVSVEQELAASQLAVETAGPIQADELMLLKQQEWSRNLLSERDLGRQQQLVNLIKSVVPMLEASKRREQERPRTAKDFVDEEQLVIEALTKGLGSAEWKADSGSKPVVPQAALAAASAA